MLTFSTCLLDSVQARWRFVPRVPRYQVPTNQVPTIQQAPTSQPVPASLPVPAPTSQSVPTSQQLPTGWEQEMLTAVNAERSKAGLPPLCMNK